MKNSLLLLFVLPISLISFPAFSQSVTQTESDTALLGLPGDNLDLYAVLNIFQQSKTIEDFEKTLNLKETGINNLDLDLNDTVDFIKVVTKQDGTNFTFILQVNISKNEIQDIAVILLSKDKEGKVTLQIAGDKDLYGKDYVIEPKPAAPAVTINPAYTGSDPVAETAASSTNVVVVESAPVVVYVYSPVYVPYYPPPLPPPYFVAFTVVAVSVYHHNNYYHHGGYHGGHGNTVVVHNTNNYNNYNNSRNSSNTVNNNKNNGNYNKNNASARPSTGNSVSPSTNQTKKSSASPSTNQSKGSSSSAKSSASQSKASSSAASKTSTSKSNTSSKSKSGSNRSRSGGGRSR